VPEHEVSLVRYYTARVGDTPDDTSRALRQDVYIRALRTLSNVVITQGDFVKTKREAILAYPPPGIEPKQRVWIRQEKGSDVCLATHLLMDALDNPGDLAVLLTNDSDFVEPIKIVWERFHTEVWVISPDIAISRKLRRVADSSQLFDQRLLERCQLPDVVIDADGREIKRPAAWTRSPA
jgi:uncharacterized LabA/DUF88 family protein